MYFCQKGLTQIHKLSSSHFQVTINKASITYVRTIDECMGVKYFVVSGLDALKKATVIDLKDRVRRAKEVI